MNYFTAPATFFTDLFSYSIRKDSVVFPTQRFARWSEEQDLLNLLWCTVSTVALERWTGAVEEGERGISNEWFFVCTFKPQKATTSFHSENYIWNHILICCKNTWASAFKCLLNLKVSNPAICQHTSHIKKKKLFLAVPNHILSFYHLQDFISSRLLSIIQLAHF